MDSKMILLVAILSLCGLLNTAQAYFVINCGKPVVSERVDPISDAGRPAHHAHDVLGGSGFNFTMDYSDTQSSNCTTCRVTKDLSNYWFPKMYYHADNGSFIEVPLTGGANIYYKQHYDPTDPGFEGKPYFNPFPHEFRMIAGDSQRRNYDETIPAQRAIQWVCIGGENENLPMTGALPNRTCQGGLSARIHFPSCWNGMADSNDHKTHVAYPSRMDSGPCPETHPKRLPFILYEVTYATSSFDELRQEGDQPYVLANGDPTGMGMHGDFLNGWDTKVLDRAINDETCGDSARGTIEKCVPLQPYLQDVGLVQCKINERVDEKIHGVLTKLPGCNKIQNGPGNATMQPCHNEHKNQGKTRG